MACRDDAAASTSAAQARQLLGALLQRWPHAPHRQCPAVLLCSAAGNGKSHLIERVVADMHTCTTSSASTTTTTTTAAAADVASARRRAVVVARPHVAAALTMQQRDGTTALRRVLRHAVEQACADEHNKAAAAAAAATGTTTTSRAVLVVLDHLEFFLRQHGHGGDDDDDEDDEQNESDDDDEAATGASYSGGGDCAYPRLLADLYAVLRSSPPLLGVDDAARLRVSAVVFVGMYTASNAAAPTLHLCRAAREDCFDVVLALPTPTEAERFALLCAQLCNSDGDDDKDDDKDDGESKDADSSKGSWRRWQRRRARALARALAQRAGGVTYAGLHELCDMVRTQQDEQQAARPHNNNDNDNTGEDEDAAVATAVARRVMRAFYGSDSVAAAAQRRSVGYVDVQEVHWRDIAGMRATKALLRRLITTPLRRRALYARCGVRPSSGVLLHGPPGTGKTMLAKAMATELNASFVYVDLPTLLRGEVGESERTLSELFASARARSPAVVFMDELQAAFGVRYARASSAHDTRLVTHLLSLLDEAHEDDAHVLLFVGATNVPQLLDPLVLRPGRLDTHVHVALPGREARAQLMRGIVCGEWATWFARDNDDGDEHTPTLDDAHAAQAWLIDTFVQHSDGLSGAALRNVAALFALQLVRVVAQQQQQLVDTRASATPVRTTHAATVARVRRALRNAFAAHAAASSTSSSSNTDDDVEAAVHGDVVVQVLQSVLHKYT